MYHAPIADIMFTLQHLAGLKQARMEGYFPDLGDDILEAILQEAGRFSQEKIAPLLTVGDRQGAVLKNGEVTTSPGWKSTYMQWQQAGWNSLSAPDSDGGQGLPISLSMAVQEIWNSGSMAFAIGPTLTMGAIETLLAHGSPEIKSKYLGKLVSGEWMGTMNLTEPQAGSDLSTIKTRAEPDGDGNYRLFGEKIFITYGEHDLSRNILHLVLARLQDAPGGMKGLSLFLVPKFLVQDDGQFAARNDVYCSGLEHKLGIHGSPTCTMTFGRSYEHSGLEEPGAVGYLVGQEGQGLAAMFTMMNNARLAVAMQGVGVAERAYQKALAFAKGRQQGRPINPPSSAKQAAPIVYHPDVKRMLMSMKASIMASRALCYACAHALDMAQIVKSEKQSYWVHRAAFLTPVAKAFATDMGVRVADIGLQIHGGMGYIEETGAAQLLRDARIAPIYEGTNGIQAIDLVKRKLPLQEGKIAEELLREQMEIINRLKFLALPEFEDAVAILTSGQASLQRTTSWLLEQHANGAVENALTGATAYLEQFALMFCSTLLAKGALDAQDSTNSSPVAGYEALTRYFVCHFATAAMGLEQKIIKGVKPVAEFSVTDF